jgi:predicted ester cyclase
MTISETAMTFFEACETGKGADVCAEFCHDGAIFSCQADALAEVTTIADYADWMKGLLEPVPDGSYELTAFAADDTRSTVVASAIFHGSNTGEGGPVPPTGNTLAADYVYVMKFDGDKIRRMTKIWNDGHSMKQLGWA